MNPYRENKFHTLIIKGLFVTIGFLVILFVFFERSDSSIDAMSIGCFLGLNLIAYSLFMLLCYYADETSERLGNFLGTLAYFFFFLSVPGCILVGFVDNLYSRRTYDRHLSDMKKLRYIAECRTKPQDWAIEAYHLDCKMYEDEFGDFDLIGWKRSEYDKLGL